MEIIVRCIFNSHLFDGFTTEINIVNVESIDELIGLAISNMHHILSTYNFLGLIYHLNMLTFTIDKLTIEDIKKNPDINIIIKETRDESSESSSNELD